MYGPNGCGKSTTAAALRHLLWGRDTETDHALLEAEARHGDRAWILERRGGARVIRPAGSHTATPPLPPPETRDRYLWALRDLLSRDDDDLAARVAREMAGGVDFNALEHKLGAGSPPAAPRKLQDEYRRVENRLRDALATQRDLQTRARELDTLRRRLRELEAEATLAAPLDLALERLDLRREKEEAERELQAFPEHMSRLRPGDADRARAADEAIRDTEPQRRDTRRRRAELEHHEPDWRAFPDTDLQQACAKSNSANATSTNPLSTSKTPPTN